MVSVRARLLAFAPLVVLTLLAAGAAVLGHRAGDDPLPLDAAPSPTGTPTVTATPGPTVKDPGPSTPIPRVAAVAPNAARVSLATAQRSWDLAIEKLVHAASGKYAWAVYYGVDPDPFQSETGGFDLDPFQSSFDRTVFSGGKKQVIHVRRIAETTYMQFDRWGSWSGCWLRVTNEQIERQTGEDLSDSLPLPNSVLAIADAQVITPIGFWFGAPYREYGAKVNAAEALVFLGFSGQVIHKQLDRLTKIDAPITISLDTLGRIHGGGVRGSQVAAAIAKAAPNLLEDLVKDLPRFRAAFAVKGLGSPVAVPPPPPKSILPYSAGRNETCAARRPRA